MIAQVENLSFAYGTQPVLKNVSFTLDAGEILCVAGPNGSGKTTLLDCVAGFLRPSAGVIRICGEPIRDLRPASLARMLAYVPQQHHPAFPYTVRDVVRMSRTARAGLFGGLSEEDEAVCEEAMRLIGVDALADRTYHTLSGGELKLVMLTRALAQQPRLIVLDEPTGSLDFANELRFLETLISLVRDQKISALIATHALDHAFYFERMGVRVQAAILAADRPWTVGTPCSVITSGVIADVFGVRAQILSSRGGGGTIRKVALLHTIEGKADAP